MCYMQMFCSMSKKRTILTVNTIVTMKSNLFYFCIVVTVHVLVKCCLIKMCFMKACECVFVQSSSL